MKGVYQILSILDIKSKSFRYFISSFITIVFSFIYEQFSHNVYSNYMIFAFLIPFSSSIIYFIIYRLKINICSRESDDLLFASTITLTFGSLMQGVLDIYGTTNHLAVIYWYVGNSLLCLWVIVSIINLVKNKKLSN